MWQIESYVGIGALKLGMTEADTEALFGPAKHKISRAPGVFQIYRNLDDPILTLKDSRVYEILLDSLGKPVYLDRLDLFGEEKAEIIASLVNSDADTCEYLGTILSRRYGIALFGFGSDDDSPRSVTLFQRGARDETFRKGVRIASLIQT